MAEIRPLSDADGELIRNCPDLLLRVKGKRAELEIESGEMFERRALFEGLSGVEDGEYCLTGADVATAPGGGYALTGEIRDEAWRVTGGLAMAFEGASVELRAFRPGEPLNGKPWERLLWLAWDMAEANAAGVELSGGPELIMLIRELCEFSKLAGYCGGEGRGKSAFPILKGYTAKLGYKELTDLFTKAETARDGKRAADKLLSKLNASKYEPLWRKLSGRLAASWEGLKSRAETYIAPDALSAARERARGLLKARGYTGEYPDFVRTGPIAGVRLGNAYGQMYFVGPERRAVFHIHCVERYDGSGIYIDHICGTRILRKGEEAGDIWSCLFDGGGYRLAGAVRAVDGEPELTADIAVRRAELMRLTNEERDAAGDRRTDRRGWGLIFAVCAAMGLLFGAAITLAAALVAALIGLALSGPSEVLPLLGTIPWWAVFALSAAIFAVSMAAVMTGLGRK